MKAVFIFLLLNLIGLKNLAQDNCEANFRSDTMSLFNNGKILEGSYIETTLKNGSVIRLFRTNDNKNYLRILVSENFYFDRIDMLEIRSGHKSYYAADSKQYKVNKNKGLFIIEVPKNYVAQLKDHGISALDFAHATTHFTKSDSKQIRTICSCFYNIIKTKINE
jgi:hypothetical protein